MMGRAVEYKNICINSHLQMNVGHSSPKSYISHIPMKSAKVQGI